MKITKETEYAIRIVDYMARNGRLTSAAVICESTAVPLRFAKNILQKLVRTGIVNSYKGIHGGYELGKLAADISLYDVLAVTEGPVLLNHCLLNGHECDLITDKQCSYYEVFQELSDEIKNKLERIKFASII